MNGFFFRDLDIAWFKSRWAWILGTVALFAFGLHLLWGEDLLVNVLAGYNVRDFSLTQRLLTESRVFGFT